MFYREKKIDEKEEEKQRKLYRLRPILNFAKEL